MARLTLLMTIVLYVFMELNEDHSTDWAPLAAGIAVIVNGGVSFLALYSGRDASTHGYGGGEKWRAACTDLCTCRFNAIKSKSGKKLDGWIYTAIFFLSMVAAAAQGLTVLLDAQSSEAKKSSLNLFSVQLNFVLANMVRLVCFEPLTDCERLCANWADVLMGVGVNVGLFLNSRDPAQWSSLAYTTVALKAGTAFCALYSFRNKSSSVYGLAYCGRRERRPCCDLLTCRFDALKALGGDGIIFFTLVLFNVGAALGQAFTVAHDVAGGADSMRLSFWAGFAANFLPFLHKLLAEHNLDP